MPFAGMSEPIGTEAASAWVGMPIFASASATVLAVVVMVCGLPSTIEVDLRASG